MHLFRVCAAAAAVGLSAVGAASAQSGDWPELRAPQGFCAAPETLTIDLEATGRLTPEPTDALEALVFVDCLELDAWRGGADIATSIVLVAQAAVRPAAQDGATEDAAGDGDLVAPLAMASVDRSAGDGAIETGDVGAVLGSDATGGPSPVAIAEENGVRYQTEILPPHGASPLSLRMRSEAVGAGYRIEREVVMPFLGEDGVRYMTAAVRAAAIADRIALAPYR